MANPRETFKYQFKDVNKVLHIGITNDLDRRESEHKREWPEGHIKQVGRKTPARQHLDGNEKGGKRESLSKRHNS